MIALRVSLYLVGLYGAYLAGALRVRATTPEATRASLLRPLPRATLLVFVTVAIPTTLQFFFPAILTLLRRDQSRFIAGEWWRLVTPLFVQDAGATGTIFNLVSLLIVGSVAERLWGSRRWLAIVAIGGIVSEVIAMSWRPVGAGNSVANFALAGSVVVAVCFGRQTPRRARVAALFALGAHVWLLLLKDIHGAAGIIGVIVGAGAILRNGGEPTNYSDL